MESQTAARLIEQWNILARVAVDASATWDLPDEYFTTPSFITQPSDAPPATP